MVGDPPDGHLRSFTTAPLSEAEIVAWGEEVGQSVGAPLFVTLSGPLGAGKSVLARAIGRGAGVTEPIPSPTYNLMLRHPVATGDGTAVVHVDLYRLDRPDELWELGWADLGQPGEIVVVEWPERAPALMPPSRWALALALDRESPGTRRLTARSLGAAPPLVVPSTRGL